MRTIPYLVKKNDKWYRKHHPAEVVLVSLTELFDVVIEIKSNGRGWCIKNNGRKRHFIVPQDEMVMLALQASQL